MYPVINVKFEIYTNCMKVLNNNFLCKKEKKMFKWHKEKIKYVFIIKFYFTLIGGKT